MREGELAAVQAKALLETLVAESPTVMLNQELLVKAVVWLAKIRTQTGETIAALADAKLARDMYEKLDPQRVDLAWDRGLESCRAWLIFRSFPRNFTDADRSWRKPLMCSNRWSRRHRRGSIFAPIWPST